MIFILAEQNESLLELLLVVTFAHFGSHNVKEIVEINCYITVLFLFTLFSIGFLPKFVDKLFDFFFLWLDSKSSESNSEVSNFYNTVSSSIKKIECLLYFQNLSISELLFETSLLCLLFSWTTSSRLSSWQRLYWFWVFSLYKTE